MRRLALLTVAMVVVGGAADAVAQRRFQVGLKTGPSFTDIAQDEDDDSGSYQRRIAAAGGGFLRLALAGPFGLQVEALSNPKGSRREDPEGFSQTLMLRYFEVPVLLRVDAPGPGPGGWFVFGGGYFAVRTSAKVQISTVENSIAGGTRVDASDAIERFDNGWVAGAGYDIGRFLVVEGRYARGLTNVNRLPDTVGFSNRALTFMVGVRY
jgi:hypothetical protein